MMVLVGWQIFWVSGKWNEVSGMTSEQFNEAEKIMNEIRETESFLKVFEEGHRVSIVAYKRATTCGSERRIVSCNSR